MYLGSQSLHKIIFSFTLGGHVYLEGLGDCAIQSSCIVILEMNAEVGVQFFVFIYVHVRIYSTRQKNLSIPPCLTTVDIVWSRPLCDRCMTVV